MRILSSQSQFIKIAILLLMVLSSVMSTPSISGDYDSLVRKGIIRFEADRSIIALSNGITGLIFDTSKCVGCKTNLPNYRFLGDLKIDSLKYLDSTIKYNEIDKSTDISINSDSLILLMKRLNARVFERRSPWSIPGDTLYWDPVRQKWHVLDDLSCHYLFTFDSSISVDSVRQLMSKVPGLISYGGIPISFPNRNESLHEIEP